MFSSSSIKRVSQTPLLRARDEPALVLIQGENLVRVGLDQVESLDGSPDRCPSQLRGGERE